MTTVGPHLAELLVQWRAREQWTQKDAADFLYISPRIYLLLETKRWRPSTREIHFFAHTLHHFDPAMGPAVGRMYGMTPEALGLPKAPAVAPLTHAHARAAYDAAVYAAAEDAELPPKVARAFAASLVARLHASGLTVEQAAQVGKAAPTGRITP